MQKSFGINYNEYKSQTLSDSWSVKVFASSWTYLTLIDWRICHAWMERRKTNISETAKMKSSYLTQSPTMINHSYICTQRHWHPYYPSTTPSSPPSYPYWLTHRLIDLLTSFPHWFIDILSGLLAVGDILTYWQSHTHSPLTDRL